MIAAWPFNHLMCLVSRFPQYLNAHDDVIYKCSEVDDPEQDEIPDNGAEGPRGYGHIDHGYRCDNREYVRE